MRPECKTKAFEAVFSAITGMARIGTIDTATLRSFEGKCLTSPGIRVDQVEQTWPDDVKTNVSCFEHDVELPSQGRPAGV